MTKRIIKKLVDRARKQSKLTEAEAKKLAVAETRAVRGR